MTNIVTLYENARALPMLGEPVDWRHAERSAAFYLPPGETELTRRVRLSRWWGIGPRALFCGLNPSTANHMIDDPTGTRWMKFAHAWGYAGYDAVNLVPFCTSRPVELPDVIGKIPLDKRMAPFEANLDVIEQLAADCAIFVACWGNGADPRWVERALARVKCDVYCIGKTGDGSPIHPMARGKHRVPDRAKPVLWRAA